MDDPTFDRVAKTLAGGLSRRRVVQLVGGGLSGALAGLLGRRAVSQAQTTPNVSCFSTSQCPAPTVCATYICVGAGPSGPGICLATLVNNGVVCGPPPSPCQQQLCLEDQCQTVSLPDNTQCGPATACTQQICAGGTCITQSLTGQPCTSACFQNTTCQPDGTCGGGAAVVCTPLDQCHVAGACDPTTGTCSNPAAPDGTACNADNNACTLDTCQAGTCVVGPAVVCPAPDLCHTAGTCDPASGACGAPQLVVESCLNGKIKRGPCDCDGTCCAAGQNCVGRRGVRRCA